MKRLAVLLLLIGLLSTNKGYSQCCAAGNPVFFGEETKLNKKELYVSAAYEYSSSDTYYSGSNETAIDFIEQAYFNYFNLQLLYGLTYRLSIQADLGYFLNKTEEYSNPNWQASKGFGVGDASLKLNYLIHKSFTRKYSIISSIGLKAPVGVFDQEVNHVKLPITVQPSSGSYKYLCNLTFIKKLNNPKWNMRALASVEYAQWIDSDNFNYKYGTLYLISFLSSYSANNFIFGMEVQSENRGRSKRDEKQVVESSGYNVLFAIPRVSYSPGRSWQIAINAKVPFFRSFNGIQLGNKFSTAVSLSYKLDSL